jgi:excisionase family DNA binding protein
MEFILDQAGSLVGSLKAVRKETDPVRLESVMEDRWLSVDEIGAYLGIKRDTVYKWITEKQMPAHRMGRLWKFRKEEVDEWVRSGGAQDNRQGNSGKAGK